LGGRPPFGSKLRQALWADWSRALLTPSCASDFFGGAWPLLVGSGNRGTPWARTHAAYATQPFGCVAAVFEPPQPARKTATAATRSAAAPLRAPHSNSHPGGVDMPAAGHHALDLRRARIDALDAHEVEDRRTVVGIAARVRPGRVAVRPHAAGVAQALGHDLVPQRLWAVARRQALGHRIL